MLTASTLPAGPAPFSSFELDGEELPKWMQEPLVRDGRVPINSPCRIVLKRLYKGHDSGERVEVEVPAGTARYSVPHEDPSRVAVYSKTDPHAPLGFYIPGCRRGARQVQLSWIPQGPKGRIVLRGCSLLSD
jgi:hypothetical protein